MGVGVDDVSNYLESEFGVAIHGSTNPKSFARVLSFETEGCTFSVTVSTEFDQDCDHGALDATAFVAHHDLAAKLRSSPTGRAFVHTGGVSVG
jgi:hypothetical protein